jgi:hypothetical protein
LGSQTREASSSTLPDFREQHKSIITATNNMATSFIPSPKTLVGQLIIKINMPFAAAVWAITMYWPSTYHEHLPTGLQSILPWPWATLVYFAISILILPIIAAEWEVQNNKHLRDAQESAKPSLTHKTLLDGGL